jgi:hypothetical protein
LTFVDMVAEIAPKSFSNLDRTGFAEAVDEPTFWRWDLEEWHCCVSRGSDEHDVVILFSLFGYGASGHWLLGRLVGNSRGAGATQPICEGFEGLGIWRWRHDL